jgi:hypothetical protein
VTCSFELLLFPFWYLDAKRGEESIYLSICHLLCYLDLACKTLIMLSGRVDMDFKTFVVYF